MSDELSFTHIGAEANLVLVKVLSSSSLDKRGCSSDNNAETSSSNDNLPDAMAAKVTKLAVNG